MVGDCVGHELGAASVMGQLRSACRALLLQDAGPGQMLTAMDRFAALVAGREYTTVFCAILDPATGRLASWAAGHPPGIVAHGDGRTVLLEGGRVPAAAALVPERREPGDGRPAAVDPAALHRRARRTARPVPDGRDNRGGDRRRQRRRRLP